MNVKQLIILLLEQPMHAEVVIDTNDDISKEALNKVTYVKSHLNYDNDPVVVIDADWGKK